jgi:hypothetical protein
MQCRVSLTLYYLTNAYKFLLTQCYTHVNITNNSFQPFPLSSPSRTVQEAAVLALVRHLNILMDTNYDIVTGMRWICQLHY